MSDDEVFYSNEPITAWRAFATKPMKRLVPEELKASWVAEEIFANYVFPAAVEEVQVLTPISWRRNQVHYEPGESYEAKCLWSNQAFEGWWGEIGKHAGMITWDKGQGPNPTATKCCDMAGFYAMATQERLFDYMARNEYWAIPRHPVYVGQVQLFGRVREGELGYMATRMQVPMMEDLEPINLVRGETTRVEFASTWP